MKRVLVTGGCGFIGRHVAQELAENGYEVRLLDVLLDQVHGAGAVNLPAGCELIKGDVRDRDAVFEAVADVDAVIHLAAEVGVGQSMYEIVRYVGSNELGTATLLETLIKHPVERIVVASSMSIYGEGLYRTPDGRRVDDARRKASDIRNGRWDLCSSEGEALSPVPTDEEKRPELASIYALTKYAQERAVLIFGQAYGIDAVALRLFNVFGAGQALSNPYTGVLANFASRLANGKRPTIFEDGHQKRDFVHVKDVARAFRLALEQRQAAGHAINIGSGHAHSIRDVARLLGQAMGIPKRPPEILQKARSGDIRNCFADISKARELLGFEPRYPLKNSLGEFAAWVRSSVVVDRGAQMRQELEERGLVS